MLLAVAELAVVLLAVVGLAVVLLVVVLVAVELVPHSVVVVVGVVVEHFLAVVQSLAVVAAAQAETGLHWVTDWEHQRAGIDQP